MAGQLRMRRERFDDLPSFDLDEGYALRTYRPGDEEHWARIINDVASLGSWTVERVHSDLTAKPQFDPTGLFFALWNDQPVATACAWRDSPGETRVGQLHMVAAMNEHKGHRLGAHVSLAVIRYFAAHRFESVYLLTDDFRLPAIRTYLNLGFDPVMMDSDHTERWGRAFATLGVSTR